MPVIRTLSDHLKLCHNILHLCIILGTVRSFSSEDDTYIILNTTKYIICNIILLSTQS